MGVVTYAGKRSQRFKWRRRLAIALVLYTILGFFVVPAVIKSQMLKRLPALTHRQAAVEQVKFNPYALSLTIRGFALKETNGEVFSSFDEFYVNFQPVASLFHWAVVFKEISLKKPFAQVTHNADGSFNFADLISTNVPPAPAPAKKPGEPPRVIIYHLSVTNGGVAIADLDRPEVFRTAFTPINVDLTNLSTIRDRNSPYSFVARTGEGESFAWKGSVTVNPLRSAGTFRLGGLNLKKYSPYSHDYARYEIANGLVDVAADYDYDSVVNLLNLTVSNAAVHLTKLELKSPDTGEMLISIPMLSVTGTDASVLKQTARVGLIKSSGGSLLVRQEADGSINLLSLLKLPTNAPTTGNSAAVAVTNAVTPASNAPPWVARIDEIAFDNYAFKIEDKKPATPASFSIDQFSLDLKGVSNVTNAPVTAMVSLRFAETGFVTVNGAATLMPPSADLQISVSNLDLRPIQPYVQEQVKLAITGGALDVHGRAQYASPESNAPLVSFTSDVALNKFATADDVLFKDFIKWEVLNVDGIKAELNSAMQPKLRVDQVKFTGLETSVVVGPDRRANLQTILRNQIGGTNTATNVPVQTATTSAPAAAKIPLDAALGTLVFENAALHYSDQSLEPHAGFDVQEFGGTITGLSSDEAARATVDLKGKVDARSPFSVSGKVNPLATNMFVDIAVAFTNTELTAFSPYTEKFAGRPLEKGKLSFAVHYLINDKALKAENGFYVDQLNLGAKNNSPDATSLPVKLAIALLKDRNGRIALDVPVTGRLDDPKFRVGPIIWQVVVNLIEKAATSPFSLLGAAFGGGDELSFVTFEPGRADLPEGETNKLETLAKALYARPAVSLEITGSVDPARDRIPIARRKLEEQLKTMWVKEQTDAGKPAVSLEQVKLEPGEHERLLRKKYKAAFGRYQPTPVSTNSAEGADTNSAAARLAALGPEAPVEHGAILLRGKKNTGATAPGISTSTASATTATGQPARPMTRAELELADMADQLVQKIEVTSDDLRGLMQERAALVQAYLLKTEKVTGERLFIIAPKPMDLSSKGEDRANLSLD